MTLGIQGGVGRVSLAGERRPKFLFCIERTRKGSASSPQLIGERLTNPYRFKDCSTHQSP